MRLPNFLIIGAPKCGTTTLYHYLVQHPDVFLSQDKEPKFFAYEGGVPAFVGPGDQERERRTIVDWESYCRLFSTATVERAVGEASVIYLYHPEAAHRIRHRVPDVKLVAILRDPVERAYSNFLHQRLRLREPLADFEAALEAEPARIRSGWGPFFHYAALGRYASQLERYFELFGRDQIRVFLYDEFEADPLGVLRDLFRFLDVDDAFVPDVSRRHLVGGAPRSIAASRLVYAKAVRRFLPRTLRRSLFEAERRWNRVRVPLDERVRERLRDQFRGDVERVEALIGKDLSSWLRWR